MGGGTTGACPSAALLPSRRSTKSSAGAWQKNARCGGRMKARRCGFMISKGNCVPECLLSRCDSQSKAIVAGQSYIPCAWRPVPHFRWLRCVDSVSTNGYLFRTHGGDPDERRAPGAPVAYRQGRWQLLAITQPYNLSSISRRRSNLSTHQQLHITRCWFSISFSLQPTAYSLQLARSVIPLCSLLLVIHPSGGHLETFSQFEHRPTHPGVLARNGHDRPPVTPPLLELQGPPAHRV